MYGYAHTACFAVAAQKWPATCGNAWCNPMNGARPGCALVAKHLRGATSILSAKLVMGLRDPRIVAVGHRDAIPSGGTYEAGATGSPKGGLELRLPHVGTAPALSQVRNTPHTTCVRTPSPPVLH